MLEGTSRPIYIEVELNDKELLWVVRDGTNCIQIEKTSGFQRFILGLCTRISLACIGASTLSCSQLFLDEGFVACDSSNLHRVPRFISSLIGIYDGVLLMSHLETIQDSVENKIKIERKDDLSLIRFGEKEYIMTLKKGGRPVKKTS
jgi:DNA repair exonuclease SbcCD ATPase subunit